MKGKLRSKAKHMIFSFGLMEERKKKILLAICFAVLIFTLNMDMAYAGGKPTTDEAWKAFMDEYRVILAAIAGIGALTSILVFIFHFIKLGTMPSHPIMRREVMNNMLVSAICTALLGGISLVLTIFYYIVFNPH
jgi:hypothetical protein